MTARPRHSAATARTRPRRRSCALPQEQAETVRERFAQYQRLLGKDSASPTGADGPSRRRAGRRCSTVSTEAVGGAADWGWSAGRSLSSHVIDDREGRSCSEPTSRTWSVPACSTASRTCPRVGGISPGPTSRMALVARTSPRRERHRQGESRWSRPSELRRPAVEPRSAGYERRQDEWVHQSKLALAELKQIEKQILAAEIRKDIAEHELSQPRHSRSRTRRTPTRFIRDKFTQQAALPLDVVASSPRSTSAPTSWRSTRRGVPSAPSGTSSGPYDRGIDDLRPARLLGQARRRGLLARGAARASISSHGGRSISDQNTRELRGLTKHVSLAAARPPGPDRG